MNKPSLLGPDEIQARLSSLPGWSVEMGELNKTYVVRSFAHAVLFVNAIAQLAEAADHHPDLRVHAYRHVTVRLSTHSAGGITLKDFNLAAQIEAVPHKPPTTKTVV
jgi:4a-hydroxytetrahydrobiopterin dehydratase